MNRKYLGMITTCFMILNMCSCQSTIGTNIQPPTDQTNGKNQSFSEKTDNEKQIDDSETTEEIIYDDFSIQIDDITHSATTYEESLVNTFLPIDTRNHSNTFTFNISCDKSALADFCKTIEIESNNPNQYSARAEYYLYLNEDELAYSDLQTAVEIDKDNAKTMFQLGKYWEKQHMQDMAFQYYCEAAERGYIDDEAVT